MRQALMSVALVLASCGGDPGPPPPALDTSSMERLVRELLDARRAAVIDRPRDADAWAALGFALDAHMMLPQAEECLGRAVALDPEGFEHVYMYAFLGGLSGQDPAEVVARYDAAAAIRADYPPLHVRRGEALLQSGRVEEARAAYEEALELDPSYDKARVGLAQTLTALGDSAAAIVLLRPVVDSAPNDRPAVAALAQALTLEGGIEEARELAERAQSLEGATIPPKDTIRQMVVNQGVSAVAHYQRAERAISAGRIDEAIALLEAVVAEREDDPRTRIQLAQALIFKRRLREARLQLEAVLARHATHAGAHALLGQLDVEAGLHADGVAHLEQAARSAPGGRLDAVSHRAWGTALGPLERWEEAAEQFRLVAELSPGDAEPLFLRVLALIYAGHPEEARTLFETARRLAPDHPLAGRIPALLDG